MSVLLRNYIRHLIEATVRPQRLFYGANASKSGSYFKQIADALIKNKKAHKFIDKKTLAELQAASLDVNELKSIFDQKLANRFIAKNIGETSNEVTLQIDLISRAWSGEELKSANKGMVPNEFSQGIALTTISFPANKGVSWLVAKQEELTAETNALDSFNQSAFGDGKPKTVVVKSTQSSAAKTFSNVKGLVKSSDKTSHADFYFVDSKGKQIPGSGISHKAKGASDKSVAERYAGVTRLMQHLAEKQTANESYEFDDMILNEEVDLSVSSETTELIQSFITDAENFYKQQALSGVEIAGFIKSIDTKKYKNEIEVMLYGPEKNDCTMLVISQVTGMSLKKSGNVYNFDAGADGKIFVRPDVPSDPAYTPVFVCRYGSGGSKFRFTPEEIEELKAMDNVPSYVKFEKNEVFIPVRLYISPAIRTPSKDAPDLAKIGVGAGKKPSREPSKAQPTKRSPTAKKVR